MRFLTAVLVLCATLSLARAGGDDLLTNAARTHFQLGRELFKQGRYAAALREFETGYQMVPKPAFLLNMAQANRKLGKLEDAAALYQRFLADAAPDDPDRVVVKELLAEVQAELARRAPPASPPTPAPAPIVVHQQPSAAVAAPAPAPAPPRRRTGLIVGVTVGVIAAVGLAVGLGVGLGAGGGDACSGVTAPCLDLHAR